MEIDLEGHYGIDSDNDSSFINEQLIRYCKERQIIFTRSRPSRKNHNCYVEQKNWLSDKEGSRIFKEKVREGSKITKRYDKGKNPYERLLECNEIYEEKKKDVLV